MYCVHSFVAWSLNTSHHIPHPFLSTFWATQEGKENGRKKITLELHRIVNPSNMNVFKYESKKNEKEKNRESNTERERERERANRKGVK